MKSLNQHLINSKIRSIVIITISIGLSILNCLAKPADLTDLNVISETDTEIDSAEVDFSFFLKIDFFLINKAFKYKGCVEC